MNNWTIKRSMVAASMFCILAGSTTWAEQGASPGDLEALKRMMQEVISENQELRIRVRELEAEMTKVKAAVTKREQAPEEAAKEVAKKPAKEIAKEPVREAAMEPAKEDKALLAKIKDRLKIQLGGAIELQAGWRRNFAGVSGSDFKVESAEFDFEADVIDWAKAELAFEWDGDADKVTLNEALVTLGNNAKFPLFLKAGRGVVPFGISEGTTVAAKLETVLTLTDPLTIEVFEAKEDFALLGGKKGGFNAGAYVFNGTTNERASGEKHLDHYGATVGYGMTHDQMSFVAAIDMINSAFDSDGLTEAFPEALRSSYSPGLAAHVKFGLGGFSLVTEYNTALRSVAFTRNDTPFRIRPTAWMIEGGYTTEIFGKKTYGAIGYSQTYQLGGAFPERRVLATIGTWLSNNMRFALEYAHDEDYSLTAGGTGNGADAFTSRLTYEW